jgi:hypothetical protein
MNFVSVHPDRTDRGSSGRPNRQRPWIRLRRRHRGGRHRRLPRRLALLDLPRHDGGGVLMSLVVAFIGPSSLWVIRLVAPSHA